MRRLILLLLAPVVLLAACSTPTEEPTAPTVETSPAATESEEASPTPDASEAEPAASPSPENSTVDTELDLQDGIRTTDFERMPDKIGELTLASRETDPSAHQAGMIYESDDGGNGLQILAYFPLVADEPTPVTDASDEAYQAVLNTQKGVYEELDATIEARSFSAGGLEWDCVEAVRSGDANSTLCLSVSHGRVIDAQYVTYEDDVETGRAAVEETFAIVAESVLAL